MTLDTNISSFAWLVLVITNYFAIRLHKDLWDLVNSWSVTDIIALVMNWKRTSDDASLNHWLHLSRKPLSPCAWFARPGPLFLCNCVNTDYANNPPWRSRDIFVPVWNGAPIQLALRICIPFQIPMRESPVEIALVTPKTKKGSKEASSPFSHVASRPTASLR
jgi:hypothetical protein